MSDILCHPDWTKWDSKEDCFVKYKHIASELVYGSLPAKKPDVSIMIPTFRRADLLKEAIESVLAQKTQYFFTITVVDNDAERDPDTDKLLKEYCLKYNNIMYYRNTLNIGMFGNWNRCIELAKAEWIAMLHDDDMLKENFIETILTIAKKKEYGIICCTSSYLDERNINKKLSETTGFGPIVAFLEKSFMKVRGKNEIPLKKEDLLRGVFMGSSAYLMKTTDALSSGGCNDEYFPSADVVFFQKMIKHYTGAYVAQQLYYYRLSKNESFNLNTIYKSLRTVSEWMEEVQRLNKRNEILCKKMYWEQMIYQYHTHLDIKKYISFNELKSYFNIPRKYCNRLIQSYIAKKYIFQWGMLLFRKLE